MSKSVSLPVLKLRDMAPEMYSRAIRVHCSITYMLSDADKNTEHLALLVAERPSDALPIIQSFELADGEKYSCIIAILHSMIARHAARDIIAEIDGPAK